MAGPSKSVYVWDLFVRIFHWSLVTSFLIAWLSAKQSDDLHNAVGYIAGGLIILRILWGFAGSRYARFQDFVRSPRKVMSYLSDIRAGREARYIGHNPAGAAMIIMLMIGLALTVFSGWLQTTDAYFGIEWVERLHSVSVHGMLVLIFGHLAGVIIASIRHHENLVKAMITGYKRP